MHNLVCDFCSSDQRFAHEFVYSSHPASFRFHLTVDTLTFGYILPTTGRIGDLHPLETCAARRTLKSPGVAAPGFLLCYLRTRLFFLPIIIAYTLLFCNISTGTLSNSPLSSCQKPVASPGGIQGETTLCGRLGQALKSDAYGDLGSSALARVLVAVSG